MNNEGRCNTCRHWEGSDIGVCRSDQLASAVSYGMCESGEPITPADFGCVYWQEKEE